ncbi:MULTISPECIES: class I SAM-dependent methyltransferase [unclassified Brevibacterium]|uniref:class I SAM-dependent methyltransferase n=1 Tax=unclassified Brevibacterium TaxID=2614124 RepID=UPI0010931692|nr:class I SAM-dependent methyltransferase [Brevibacterium sp. S22]TGD32662.1 class I SAM-dependent methyltransferase [Brevibacterium sp. S22]
MEYFENRERAESFGEVATDYDAYRPKYPAALVSTMINAAEAGAGSRVPRILDVGSGTGILAVQLGEAGADVLAVEPDAGMADVARAKGLDVEISGFETWDSRGRTFDLVSFGQSFHWVDPMIALPKIRDLLEPGGSLALAWNDIEPCGELRTRLDAITAGFHSEGTTASLGTAASAGSAASAEMTASAETAGNQGPAGNSATTTSKNNFEPVEHPALAQLRAMNLTPRESTFTEDLHYSRHGWLSMVFTHSAQLTMDPVKRAVMREEMNAEIPAEGLAARNEALLILAHK